MMYILYIPVGYICCSIGLLCSTLGECIPFVSLLSGCCAISEFVRHLTLADHSPQFDARAGLQTVEIECTLLIHDYY